MKRCCNISRDGQSSKRTLNRLEEQLICQERNAASNYSAHCDDSSFIVSGTTTILSCSESEETHDSFQDPESLVVVFDNTDDKQVHLETPPENEYES